MTAEHCENTSLPSSWTNPTGKLTTFKTCFKLPWQSFQVTTTFIFRSHPLEEMKLTTHKNEGQITPREAHEGRPAMGALQGTTITTTPPPSKIKSQTIKRLQTKMTMSPQIRGTDTRHNHLILLDNSATRNLCVLHSF
jgi:hypothetical protein